MNNHMKKTFGFALLAAAACLPISSTSFAMTDAECTTAWTTADANKDGGVTIDEGARYHAAIRVGDKSIADGKLSQADFTAHCKAGLFDVRANDTGAPLKWANSFTEAQAHDRATAYGLSSVAGLKKDADGIWRGTAQKDGKPVSVGIDYKRNVVAN